jgi:hypothetical protein
MTVVEDTDRRENLTGFFLDDLPPMPSPHRRTVAAVCANRHIPSHAR